MIFFKNTPFLLVEPTISAFWRGHGHGHGGSKPIVTPMGRMSSKATKIDFQNCCQNNQSSESHPNLIVPAWAAIPNVVAHCFTVESPTKKLMMVINLSVLKTKRACCLPVRSAYYGRLQIGFT
jgi:hypothetical protein